MTKKGQKGTRKAQKHHKTVKKGPTFGLRIRRKMPQN